MKKKPFQKWFKSLNYSATLNNYLLHQLISVHMHILQIRKEKIIRV